MVVNLFSPSVEELRELRGESLHSPLFSSPWELSCFSGTGTNAHSLSAHTALFFLEMDLYEFPVVVQGETVPRLGCEVLTVEDGNQTMKACGEGVRVEKPLL